MATQISRARSSLPNCRSARTCKRRFSVREACASRTAGVSRGWTMIPTHGCPSSDSGAPLGTIKCWMGATYFLMRRLCKCRQRWPSTCSPDCARDFRSLGLTGRARPGPQIVEDDRQQAFGLRHPLPYCWAFRMKGPNDGVEASVTLPGMKADRANRQIR